MTVHLPIYRKDGNTLERFDYQMVEYKGYYFIERLAHWLDKKGKPQSQVIQVYHLGKDDKSQNDFITPYINLLNIHGSIAMSNFHPEYPLEREIVLKISNKKVTRKAVVNELAIHYLKSDLLRLWKILPDTVLGYNTYSGFVVAAYSADAAFSIVLSRINTVQHCESINGKVPIWIIKELGLDLTGEGNRLIFSEFKAG